MEETGDKNRTEAGLITTYRFMSVVLVMYMIKASLNIWVGWLVNSPVIAGDGYHSASDFFVSLTVIFSVWLASRPESPEFPWGLCKVQNIMQVIISLSLFAMGFDVLHKSVMGIMGTNTQSALIIAPRYFLIVTGTMAISAAASFFIGQIQVKIGRENKQDAVVDDGTETINDGYIELIALSGILAEYGLGAAWVEYPLGLLMSLKVLHVACEIGWGGLKDLLQAGVDPEILREIWKIIRTVHGVEEIEPIDQAKTFKNGHQLVCNIKISTYCDNLAVHEDMKLAIAHKVGNYLEKNDLGEFCYYIRFCHPDRPRGKRIAYAVTLDGDRCYISNSIADATHVRICDLVGATVVRQKDVLLPPCAYLEQLKVFDSERLKIVADTLTDKKTHLVYCFSPSDDLFASEMEMLAERGITLERTLTPFLSTVGM